MASTPASPPALERGHASPAAYWALAAVCFFWGTTYLGIRIALESFPPFLLMAMRFTLSGGLLLIGAKLLGYQMPQGKDWLWSAFHGLCTIGIGTGSLVWAETYVPSGLAALFVATGPFWLVGMEALVPGGEPLHKPAIAGMLVGLAGLLMLVVPGLVENGFNGPLIAGFLILQLSAAGWALGSSLLKQHQTRAHPVVAGGVQQLGAGLAFILPGLLQAHQAHWDKQGISAIVYLAIFGSIVGYSSYVYSLRHLPVAMVSLYNYINPVVAAVFGWLVYREAFGVREAVAMGVIFVGVWMVKRSSAG
jgi:drug/metabolite transporter (DMT)-like permease